MTPGTAVHGNEAVHTAVDGLGRPLGVHDIVIDQPAGQQMRGSEAGVPRQAVDELRQCVAQGDAKWGMARWQDVR